jgi:autophagy-related protein 9
MELTRNRRESEEEGNRCILEPLLSPKIPSLTVNTTDDFFISFYSYWSGGGIVGVLLTECLSILCLIICALTTICLICVIDYDALQLCRSEDTCDHVSNYIRYPFIEKKSFGAMAMFSTIFSLVLVLFVMWRGLISYRKIMEAWNMDSFYRDTLKIDSVGDLTWNEVLQQLLSVHNNQVITIATQSKITEVDICHRILRKTNFFTALACDSLMDEMLQLPWWFTPFFSDIRVSLTPTLEYCIFLSIMEFAFDHDDRLKWSFRKNEGNGLASRFRILGISTLMVLPYTLIYESVLFLLENIQQFHVNRNYLGPRQWTSLALLRFRGFLELPHAFELRMYRSFQPANEYLALSQHPHIGKLAHLVTFICGAIIAILLLCSLIDEAILLYVVLGNHNLIWYLGIFSATFSAARAVVPSEPKSIARLSREELLDQLNSHIHYSWTSSDDESKRRVISKELINLFPYKIYMLVCDVISGVMIPVILFFKLPSMSSRITEFITNHTVYVEGIGDVCEYSLFETSLENMEQEKKQDDGINEMKHNMVLQHKIESSAISFKMIHLSWYPGPRIQKLLDGIQDFRIKCNTSSCNANNSHLASSKDITHVRNYGSDESPDLRHKSEINMDGLHPELAKILIREGIDIDNDTYWLTRFRQTR